MSDVITVYTKPSGVQCNAVKRRLDAAGIPYETLDLTEPAQSSTLTDFKARGFLSAPVTTFRGVAIPGYNPDALDELIAKFKET